MCSNEKGGEKLGRKGVEFGKLGRCMQQLLQQCRSEVNDVTTMLRS